MPPCLCANTLGDKPHLREVQASLPDNQLTWHDTVNSPTEGIDGPVFGIANEFLTLFLSTSLIREWTVEVTSVAVDDRMEFVTGESLVDDIDFFPKNQVGQIAELCPEADQVMAALAVSVAQRGGAVLIIDYGRDGNPGNSLQAVAAHASSIFL